VSDYTLRDMLKRYSEFISFPIALWTEKTEYETVPDPDAEATEGEEPPTKTVRQSRRGGGRSGVGPQAKTAQETERRPSDHPPPLHSSSSAPVFTPPPPLRQVPKTSNEWETINVAKPIWMRPPKEVEEDEYSEFYKATFRAYDEPDAHVHFSLEGQAGPARRRLAASPPWLTPPSRSLPALSPQVEFRALLYLPSSVPWELSQDMFNDKVKPVKLYVKRVFISENFEEQLLPRWLSFIKGVVDSEDLPLNVSREILQKSKVLSIISKRLVRKALDMIGDIAKDEDKFARFSSNFGRYIKVGVIEDRDNKDALLKLATFTSTAEPKASGTTLPQYVDRMKEGQKQIYYVSAASKAAAASSPVIESLRKKGYEVLVALDQIDEIALQGVGKFGDFDVVDAAKENVDLGEQSDEEKAEVEEAKKSLEATCAAVKAALGDKVDKVEVSSRLTSSPSALVQPQWGMSPQMQRFMKAQAAATGDDLGGLGGMGGMAANLELNPAHAAVRKLKGLVAADANATSTRDYATLLYDVAAVSSGYELADPAAFAARVVTLMTGEAEEAAEEEPPAADAAAPADAVPSEAPAESSDGDSDGGEAVVPEVL